MYYNRFRYYSPETGLYISKDPIGLAGGLALYGYVSDVNKFVDIFGLEVIAKINSVKIIAYPGPDVTSNRPEHRPYHIHIEEGNHKTRVLLEDFEKQGKIYQPGDVYPGDPSMTKKMKKIIENQDLEDLLDKTKQIYNGCK